MLVVTTDNIPGYEIGMLGTVKGTVIENNDVIERTGYNTVKAAHSYNNAIDNAMQMAVEEAEKLGADAIVSLKFSYNNIGVKSWENDFIVITAYGTAVALKISSSTI